MIRNYSYFNYVPGITSYSSSFLTYPKIHHEDLNKEELFLYTIVVSLIQYNTTLIHKPDQQMSRTQDIRENKARSSNINLCSVFLLMDQYWAFNDTLDARKRPRNFKFLEGTSYHCAVL